MTEKRALITGATGQDGAYLAKLLLDKGYRVYGTSRDAKARQLHGLQFLGIAGRVRMESMALNDFRSVIQVLMKTEPDEIYNLAGQSSVGLSFLQPVETLESLAVGTLNLLEAIRLLGRPVKLYNACSSECFGDTGKAGASETTPFMPRSPYAVSKATSFWLVANYREAYGLEACSGLLFNHESPLRPERFVTRKIVATACRISLGSREKLRLGDVTIRRDWGWAPEYVEAMWRMLQAEQPDDFVIATGESNSLKDFASAVFACLGLDLDEHLIIDPSLFRPTDIKSSMGIPDKAAAVLGWQAKLHMREVVSKMVEAELAMASPTASRRASDNDN